MPLIVSEVSRAATDTARAITDLREEHRAIFSTSANALRLLVVLFRHPLVSIRFVEKKLGVTFVTAGNLVERLQAAGLLLETTGKKRNRWFRYEPYYRLFEKQVPKVG